MAEISTKLFKIVSGYVPKDADYSEVGPKSSPRTKFSIKIDERAAGDGTYDARWESCVCWNDLAVRAKDIRKGDFVLAAGKVESREYNGKMYHDLRCDFFAIAPREGDLGGGMIIPPAFDIPGTDNDIDDDDLPF